jgi:DNA-binding transcriptional ArsR family regulator
MANWSASGCVPEPGLTQFKPADVLSGFPEVPTLSTHLDVMEEKGLLTRRRDSSNRRVHLVQLIKDGEAAFLTLRAAAVRFDRQLCAGIADAEITTVASVLGQLVANIAVDTRGHLGPTLRRRRN